MVRFGNVGRSGEVAQLVVAIGNVHLLLADQLEIEPIHGPVEYGRVVIGRCTRGAGVRGVVRNVRGELDTTLAGQVLPCAPPLLQRVG